MPRKTKQRIIPEEQTQTNVTALVIGENKGEKLSKVQLEFNSLAKEIEKIKLEIEDFEAEFTKASVKVAKDIIPLTEVLHQKLRGYILALDDAAQQYELKKGEQQTLERHIHEIAWVFYSTGAQLGEPDEEIKAIHDKYSPDAADDIIKDEMEDRQAMFKSMFGLDIDIEKMKDPEYMAEMEEQVNNRAKQMADEAPQRKKTKKQLEAEAKEEELKQLEAKDARSVYTSLAKLLHPDLEQDEQERLRKTEMMKRVTQAYTNNDFFELLKLQLEYNMAHPEHLAGLAEAQLNRYISMLKKQKQELEEQKYSIRQRIGGSMQKLFTWTNKFSAQKFSQELRILRENVASCENDIAVARNPALLRERLKQIKKEQKQEDQFGNLFYF